MVDQIEKFNMINIATSESACCVKEEISEDNIDIISKTASIVNNVKLQNHMKHDKIKQYDMSIILDNIKKEVPPETQYNMINDNIKVEEGISISDIKIEFGNQLYCEHCHAYYEDYCINCDMLVHILNRNFFNSNNREQEELPNAVLEIRNSFGQFGIFALKVIPEGVKFGPFSGLNRSESPWRIKLGQFVVKEEKSKGLHWMKFVNYAKTTYEQNLLVSQFEDNIYYQSTRKIHEGDELLVYFGEEYEDKVNTNVEVEFIPITECIVRDTFACTFCCLGFSSISHLTKHRTIRHGDAAGRFSIEELMQCPFCNIHLDQKEYFDHHMVYCSKRNFRKSILPSMGNQTAKVKKRKSRRLQVFKCKQCKYETNYKAVLKNHTNQHCKVKTLKCWICYRRFKRKSSFRLHMENTHNYVVVKDDPEQSTGDYMNPRIKIEYTSSQGEMKQLNCSLCEFQTKYEPSLNCHLKTKHLKDFRYTCDLCDYKTNSKWHFGCHKKTKHLKVFDYKCDKCEYRTNIKSNLGGHKKKHVIEFQHKCDSCEFRTNRKYRLKNHIKNHIKIKHFKDFDYKCDTCHYKTNKKSYFESHLQTKHSKKYYYKCDSCEFQTNNKQHFEYHVKAKHSKIFDYKCDSCEFITNGRHILDYHVKTKHLNEFDYRCDSCTYKTNIKINLERHIKTKHLNKFDYGCDICDYKTNHKPNLKRHTKTKHLKEYDYGCDTCEFKTNHKLSLEIHVQSKHLKESKKSCFKSHSKELQYKCDSCEFITNSKQHFEYHVKAKHLKVFDYRCDSCEFRTNDKNYLGKHIKTKHLQEYDFNCDVCHYKTNHKPNLKIHMKSEHLKEYDHKCHICTYKTNHKRNLEIHVKTKHSKEFYYKGESAQTSQ